MWNNKPVSAAGMPPEYQLIAARVLNPRIKAIGGNAGAAQGLAARMAARRKVEAWMPHNIVRNNVKQRLRWPRRGEPHG